MSASSVTLRVVSLRKLMLPALCVSACFSEPSYEDLLCSAERPCPDGFVCRSERCARSCVTADQCPAQHTCRDGACSALIAEDAGKKPEDAGMIEPDCGPCDLAEAVCLENDSVYRAYVNLGPCPEDPSQCVFAAFDMDCPSCSNTCLIPCRDQVCDELAGGCRQAGYCVPNPGGGAACAYVAQVDSSTCTTSLDEPGLCQSGVCFAVEPEPVCDAGSCDDMNPCTDDSCDATGGCLNVPNTDDCDDGDLCTFGDRCRDRVCVGTTVNCTSDACLERACDGTANCSEQPMPIDTPCVDDGEACTRDVCDGAGACVHPGLPNGTQCGPLSRDRCCSSECVNISTDERHCGGCGTACDQGFACEPIESTPDCGPSYPSGVSGRCLCSGANSQCPDGYGQVCRLTQYLDGNRCVPDSTTAMPCSAGQTVEVINLCPGYCAY